MCTERKLTRAMVEDELLKIGVNAANLGFRYITEAVLIIDENPEALNMMTKELYPGVAIRVASLPTRVERAIRGEVERLYSRRWQKLPDALMFFEPERDKPRNGEFLARLHIYLRRVADGTREEETV